MLVDAIWTQVDKDTISNKPYLTEHTIKDLDKIGTTYFFKIVTFNEIGESESLPKGIVLAANPTKPTNAPTQDFKSTTKKQIKILYEAIAVTETGGSDILGYDLWRDDGAEGDFKALYKINNILALSYVDFDVKPGRLYRYKYRARNVNGYSEFSKPGYLYAASVPNRPNAPTLISVTANTIKLQMYSPTDSGDTKVLSYLLVMD